MLKQRHSNSIRFATPCAYYIYDVYSNEILRLTASEDQYLSAFDIAHKFSTDAGGPTVSPQTSDNTIDTKALDDFVTSGNHLKDIKPKGLKFPFCSTYLDQQYENGLGQLILNVTNSCNLRCKYCIFSGEFKNRRTHSNETMSEDVAISSVRYFSEHSKSSELRSIGFYGGEPLLAFDLIRKVILFVQKEMKDIGFNLTITTNGTLLTNKIADFLHDNNVTIHVSIDGPQKIHDSKRIFKNGKGTFQRILTNLTYILNKYPNFYKKKVWFSTTLHSYSYLPQLRHMFEKGAPLFSGNNFIITSVDTMDSDLVEKGIVDFTDKREYHKLVKEYIRVCSKGDTPSTFLKKLFDSQLLRIDRRSISKMPEYLYPNGICVPGVRRLFVNSDGSFAPCERVNENLKIGDYASGIDRTKAVEHVKKYIETSFPDCTNCWAVRLCSLCFNSLFSGAFDIDRKRKLCESAKLSLINNMILYCICKEGGDSALSHLAKYKIT